LTKFFGLHIFLYNFFLKAYSAAIHIAALWNPKARSWLKGRKNWREKLNAWKLAQTGPIATTTPNASNLVWMHCASLGEFEQGRPLLEAVKVKYPHYKIVLTFFSPSGYEIRKNYEGADLVMYLPMDGFTNAKYFIDTINPSLVLWVKYEYWHYFLLQLKKKNIPVLLISGIFRSSQPFFKWYGQFWINILGAFDHFFVQTTTSLELLHKIGIRDKITVTGDTRFDRVVAIAEQWNTAGEAIDAFCSGHQVLVAGSTWEEDEELLIHYAKAYPKIRFIIAPHEVSKERIQDLKEEFPSCILYSKLTPTSATDLHGSNVLIIDNVGLLSKLYKYASIAYVGGGFNTSGIHNILEAAVYGKPVIFGPVYEKFAEARDLIEAGGAFPIENALELEALLNDLFTNTKELETASLAATQFVYSHKGATQKIMDHIQRKRLLIN